MMSKKISQAAVDAASRAAVRQSPHEGAARRVSAELGVDIHRARTSVARALTQKRVACMVDPTEAPKDDVRAAVLRAQAQAAERKFPQERLDALMRLTLAQGIFTTTKAFARAVGVSVGRADSSLARVKRQDRKPPRRGK